MILAYVGSLAQILPPLRAAKGQEHTHTSLGPPFGSYYVPGFHVPDFLAAYRSALERGADLHRHTGPVIVDLDFRFKPTAEEQADPASLRRRHSEIVEEIAPNIA
jgi:hypothetical protein